MKMELTSLVFWGIVTPLYGIAFFLPTIIRDLGYTAADAQLLTVPIYVTAAGVGIIVAWLSDRQGTRTPFMLGTMIVGGLGYVIVLASAGRGVPGVVYFGVFVVGVGMYPAFPGSITLMSSNLAGSYKRAIGMAIHVGVSA